MFFSSKNLASLVALLVMSFVMLPGCKQGEFSGGSGGTKTGDARKDVSPKKLGDPEPIGKEKEPDDEGEDEEPGNDEDNNNPPDDTVNNTNDNGMNEGLIDLLGGILKKTTEQITQENNNEVITAPGKAFRIGDGAATATSCAEKVVPVGVRGKIYYFEFEVTKDATDVAISFGVTCGIDYSDTNFIILKKGGTEVLKQNMSKNVTGQGMPNQVLGVGKYTIIVESRSGTADPVGDPTDFDDFLVGELKVKANKPIKAGRIGAQ
jgi:hypothetical protein